MKKLLLVLLIGVVSLTAFSAGIEVRGGMDLSAEQGMKMTGLDEEEDLASGGYVLRVEYLFGDVYEYGAGLAYKYYASLDEDDNDETSTTSTIVYGTGKLNMGEPGMNPYLRINAGVSSVSGDYFDYLEESNGGTVENAMGMYYGLGLGIEYSNFLIEAVYEVQTVATELDISGTTFDIDYTYTTTSLELGYKFGAGN